MTNTVLLRQRLKDSGYRLRFVAQRLGLSYQGFLNKIENRSYFNANEIACLSSLLSLTMEEVEEIFLREL